MNPSLIGYLAGVLVSVSLAPQVIKSWRTKSTKDISVLWTLMLLAGLVLWLIYGLMVNDWPIIISSTAEGSFAASLLVLKIMYSKK